jgi:hypothetical protein
VGVLIIDCHDCVLPKEEHCVTPVRDFLEFHALTEGPRDHENLYHVVVPELVWAGLLEESLKVVCRRSCLALAATCRSRNAPDTEAAYFLIVASVIVGRSCSPLRMLLAPFLATVGNLIGIVDGDVGRCLLVVASGHLPAA